MKFIRKGDTLKEFSVHHELMDKKYNNHPRTAGRLMTDKIPRVPVYATVEDTEKYLMDNIEMFDSVNYIYAVDEHHRLKGIVSIKELFRCCNKDMPVSQIMTTNIFSVRPSMSRERAAYGALNHEIKAVPVVDKEGVFLGAITSDKILSILHKEMQDDLLKLGGIKHADIGVKSAF
ncbi:MAG: CBS domain-containing protein [Nitrospirota bacterium]